MKKGISGFYKISFYLHKEHVIYNGTAIKIFYGHIINMARFVEGIVVYW